LRYRKSKKKNGAELAKKGWEGPDKRKSIFLGVCESLGRGKLGKEEIRKKQKRADAKKEGVKLSLHHRIAAAKGMYHKEPKRKGKKGGQNYDKKAERGGGGVAFKNTVLRRVLRKNRRQKNFKAGGGKRSSATGSFVGERGGNRGNDLDLGRRGCKIQNGGRIEGTHERRGLSWDVAGVEGRGMRPLSPTKGYWKKRKVGADPGNAHRCKGWDKLEGGECLAMGTRRKKMRYRGKSDL